MRRVAFICATPALSVLWLAVGPGPKFEEAFFLLLGTFFLCSISLATSLVWNIRPITGALIIGASVLTLWWGTCVKVAAIYGYGLSEVLEMPAMRTGAECAGAVAVALCAVLAGARRRARIEEDALSELTLVDSMTQKQANRH